MGVVSRTTGAVAAGQFGGGGSPAGLSTFTVGSEAADVINVQVQLKDASGSNLGQRGSIFGYLSSTSSGSALATAPSGGAAIAGGNGLLIEQIADRAFQMVSTAAGLVSINITEVGATTFYLVLCRPDGRLDISGAITFA